MEDALVEVRKSSLLGGRGVFACRDLEAGMLLMHEEPFFVLPEPDDENLHLQMARSILKGGVDEETFSALHPELLDEASISRGEKQLHSALDKLSAPRLAALHVLLKCQFNAFHSGLVCSLLFFFFCSAPHRHVASMGRKA
jgi:hypothetical protein